MHGYKLGFRGDIEGLRAIAVLLVVAAHAGVPRLAGGFIGVDVFFVLSGFLITGLLNRELAERGRIDFGAFYLRRLRRLMPALLLVVLVVSALASHVLAPWDQGRQASAAAMASIWLSNIHFALAKLDYFAPGAEANLFLHTWSLGVEEQFYLLWPALLLGVWLLAKRKGQSFRELGTAILLAMACVSLVAELMLMRRLPQWSFYMMPMRAWQFAAGGLIWALPAASGQDGSSWRRCMAASRGWIGLALILGAALWLDEAVPYPGWRAFIPTLGAALVIHAGMQGGQLLSTRLLASWPLQGIGRISYAWYLWHWPALLLGGFALDWSGPPLLAVEVLASFVLAILTYRFVESPLRRHDGWLTYRRAALLASVALMAAMNAGAFLWHNQAIASAARPDMQRYAKAYKDTPAIYAMGCDDWYKSDAVKICMFGPGDAEHTAVLMGDSIAGQWFPAMARAFHRPGWRLLVVTKSSCPMVDQPFFYERIRREYTECAKWRSAALERMAAIRPDLLMLSTVSNYGFTEAQWVNGTASVLDAVAGSAKRVVVMRSTPSVSFDGPSCLATHIGTSDACKVPYQDEPGERVFAWQRQAVARFPNASAMDFNDLICPAETCAAVRDGQVVFRDSQHVTASFAASLGDTVAARLGLDNASNAASMDAAR